MAVVSTAAKSATRARLAQFKSRSISPSKSAKSDSSPIDHTQDARKSQQTKSGEVLRSRRGRDSYAPSSDRTRERQNVQSFAAHGVATAEDAANQRRIAKVAGRVKRGLGGVQVQASQSSGTVALSAQTSSNSSAVAPNDGAAPGYDGNPDTSLVDAAKVLREHIDTLDSAAGGRQDGKFGLADLEAVAADASQPQELRDAAQTLLADPNKLNALDVAGGPRVDRRFSIKDLDRVIAEGEQNQGGMTLDEIAENLGHEAEPETEGREGWSNFDVLDAAKTGRRDGKVSRDDLEIVANDPAVSEELRDTAQALLDNDNLFNALDVAKGRRRDGKFSSDDLKNVNYSPTPETEQNWTGADARALDRALENGGSFDDLYGGVYQTDRGNCASTAVIKAAMDTYGTDVFKSVEKLPNGGYEVELQDGHRVSLTREEMEAAATGAHYKGDDPEARAFATLCYGVMAKRAQMMGHEGADTYAEALLSLANGEVTKNVPEYLGLGDKVHKIDVDEIEDHDGVVAYGNGHAVFVDEVNGEHYTDAWGKAHEYDGTNEVDKPNNALQGAYYFEV